MQRRTTRTPAYAGSKERQAREKAERILIREEEKKERAKEKKKKKRSEARKKARAKKKEEMNGTIN